MAHSRTSSSGRLLNIELDSPPNYVYTNGEIVSGRVTLRSSSDEDVCSIVLQLTGLGESYVGMAGRNNQQVGLPDQWSGQIFLDMHKQLYHGMYKLRKDVTYEWPFKIRFPDSRALVPSGSHGKHQMMSNGDTWINYELKASRATSPEQAKALLEKAAKGQGAGLKSKVRGFAASTTSLDLIFLPSRPSYIPPELTPTREVWTLPIRATGDSEAASGQSTKFSFKSLFKPPPSVAYTVRVDLPKNFVQFERLPAFIRVIPKFSEAGEPTNPGPITVEKVEYILSMRVRHKASGYVGENLEQRTILKLDHPGIVITDTGRYDIGGQYSTKHPMWPTFNCDLVETRHNLRAHVTLNASGKKFHDIFTLMNCNVYPNRMTASPLNKDYICSLFPQSLEPLSSNEEEDGEVAIPHKAAIDAFFAVSRLLTSKNIYPQVVDPHNPSAVLTLLLPGQTNLQAKPFVPMPESSILPGTLTLPNPQIEDQRWISSILESDSGLQSTTSQFSGQGGFAYRYGGKKSASQVRLELSDATTASSSLPPPCYSDSPASHSLPPPQSTLTLSEILNALLHSLAISDTSSPELVDRNALTLSNIQHLCQVYSAQLRVAPPGSASICIPDAQGAVAKYPELRRPLVALAGLEPGVFGEEVEDEPPPRVLTKAEARFERRKELANKVGYWSATAQKREQVFQSN